MSDENESGASGNDESARDSRLPWAVMGFLVFALMVGGIAFGKKKKEEKPPERTEVARAVVVPTADSARTVVVAPCEAPLEQTLDNVSAGQPPALATVVELPRGEGVRTVLVPHCTHGTGLAGGRAPSIAIVLASREDDAGAEEAESRAIVPAGSGLTTIVVPRCTKPGVKSDSVLGPHEGDRDLAVARDC